MTTLLWIGVYILGMYVHLLVAGYLKAKGNEQADLLGSCFAIWPLAPIIALGIFVWDWGFRLGGGGQG
jgi:formate-dependent nitrite reductase membrane component NrfD